MGLPDIACSVYRASQRPYRGLFEKVWGQQAFAIEWPNDVEQVCDQPGPPPANDPMPVHLGPLDRGRAAATFDQMAQSIAVSFPLRTSRRREGRFVSGNSTPTWHAFVNVEITAIAATVSSSSIGHRLMVNYHFLPRRHSPSYFLIWPFSLAFGRAPSVGYS
jgi:hypothetical protein